MGTFPRVMSPYFLQIDDKKYPGVRCRYMSKIEEIDRIDPYTIGSGEWSQDSDLFPMVNWGDMVMYLVYGTSTYSLEQFKCFKSLEAYNQFVSGWVQKVQVHNVAQLSILTSRVMHSQKLSETPLKPWVIASMDGTIHSAHCNCMAGLSETCTHIGALLFAVEFINRQREKKTVTQEKAYWLVPSVSKADYREVCHIDFSSARSKKAKLDKALGEMFPPPPPPEAKPTRSVPLPSSEEISRFFNNISQSSSKPAILSLVSPYNKMFIPTATKPELPPPLAKLFDINMQGKPYGKIITACEKAMTSIKITKEQADHVEKLTRDQSKSKLWFSCRAGRITASKLKSACHSDPRMPSKSLINSICYPEAATFSTKATKHGLTNEEEVLCKYEEHQKSSHSNFTISKSGFSIHTEVPYIGATPDSIVSCSCCGNGCVEVKCPYSKKDMTLSDAITSDKGFFLEKSDNGDHRLKRTHAYYYQVQCQVHCTNTDYCDFVVWTGKDFHVERIMPDYDFWEVCLNRARSFFLLAIFPELLARYYSSPASPVTNATVVNENSMCYCHASNSQNSVEGVITCSYNKCPYRTFHNKCLRFTNLHLTEQQQKLKNWFCPDCVRRGVCKETVNRKM